MDPSEILAALKIDRSEPPPPRFPFRRIVLMAVLAVAIGLALRFGLHRSEPPMVRIVTARLSAGASATSLLDATGYVVARRQATVSAKITGKVEEVLIEEGQRVQAGQILATLDRTDADAQYRLALAQRDAARKQLDEWLVQRAQAVRDRARQADLAARRLLSRQAAEQAATQVDTFDARLAVQRHQIEVAERSLQVAAVNLDNTRVRAPFNGVIVAKTAQPGEIVSPMSAGGGFTRTGIGTIVDMESLEIEVDVNEAFIGRVQPGQAVEARLNAYPDWAIPAEVIAIIPTADRSKATVKVRIALNVKDARIVPEMGIRVAFLQAQPTATPPTPQVIIPRSAVRTDAAGAYVFRLAGTRATRQPVELGEERGEQREIIKGLADGDRLILDPPPGLADGSAVRPGEADPP